MCKKTIVTCAITVLCLVAFAQEEHGRHRPNGGERPRHHAREGENGDRKMHRSSESGERRRPQLNEETRKLIAAYRRDPTEANKTALRKQVEADYEKRIERKKAELAELKRTAGSESRVKELEGELDEMIQSRDRRIDQMMTRFTEKRSRPDESEAREGRGPHERRGGGRHGGGRHGGGRHGEGRHGGRGSRSPRDRHGDNG